VAQQTQDAGKRIAKDGGANMADVHWLGNVRRAEIDDDRARRSGFLEEKMFATRSGLQRIRNGSGFEPEIEKTGASNFNRFAQIGDIKPGDDFSGQLARIHFPCLGEDMSALLW